MATFVDYFASSNCGNIYKDSAKSTIRGDLLGPLVSRLVIARVSSASRVRRVERAIIARRSIVSQSNDKIIAGRGEGGNRLDALKIHVRSENTRDCTSPLQISIVNRHNIKYP